MAGLPRKLQKIFGGSLSPTGNIADFASLAQGSPAYSGDLDAIQTAQWLQGWIAALINAPGGLASPALEDFNGVLYTITSQLSYLFARGIPEWIATETYNQNDFVKVGSTLYVSKTDNNLNHLVTDTNNWQTYASTLNNAQGIAKAWVCFNGNTGAISSAFNVSSITKNAVGNYTLNFTTALANALYAFSGSCGTGGGAFAGGDDNVVTGGFSGAAAIKSTTQLTVFCVDTRDRILQDSQSICVVIFGT